jgi:hypothetical protein
LAGNRDTAHSKTLSLCLLVKGVYSIRILLLARATQLTLSDRYRQTKNTHTSHKSTRAGFIF